MQAKKQQRGGARANAGAKKKPETYIHQVRINKQLRELVIEELGVKFVNQEIVKLFLELGRKISKSKVKK